MTEKTHFVYVWISGNVHIAEYVITAVTLQIYYTFKIPRLVVDFKVDYDLAPHLFYVSISGMKPLYHYMWASGWD